MNNTSMTIRTDKEIKQQAQKIFSDLGMDMSTAINVFFAASNSVSWFSV